MAGRLIATGDIHGCSKALATLVEVSRPSPEDILVPLGDYIDRGPDSRGVLDLLIAAARDRDALRGWLSCGGVEALRSYGWAPGGPRRNLAR
jgi:serine/threonine protein phosphatase 1